MLKFLMFFIYFVIRPIPTAIVEFFYYLYYKFKILTDEKSRLTYLQNFMKYQNIQILENLNRFFSEDYKYKYDGPMGIFDHDNSKAEFFTSWGDCDDVAMYAAKKLKKLGYKNVTLIYLWGAELGYCHFDTAFDVVFNDGKKVRLFNYGQNIEAQNLESAVEILSSNFKGKVSKTFIKVI